MVSVRSARVVSVKMWWCAAMVALIGVAAPLRADERGPKIVIPESVYDFGSVPQGQRVVHEFVIQNAGTSDLTLQRISPSCGCTAAVVSSPVIKPGTSEKVRVEFDTAGFSGAKTKSVSILTSVLDKPEVTLKLSGTVVSGVTLSPERLEFGEIDPSASVGTRTKEFTVRVEPGSDLVVSGVTSFSKFLTVTQVGAEPGSYRYSVVMKEGAPKGEIRDRVLIEFEGGRRAGVNVPVTASIVSDLRVIPPTVSFGVVDGKEIVERRVKFENKSEQKVAVKEIVSSHPAVSASLVEVSPGKKGVLVVKLDPKKVNGDLRASLDLITTHPVEEKLSLSVFGVQPPR